jgi:Creatinase/Prolidase N-terminal domain
MRRGLISRSTEELPDAVLDARIARVHAAMGEAGLDALLAYTNNTRPAGVSWLTGFVPYWSEALLVLPRAQEPVLVVALTYRVKTWIERTSRVGDVIHTPRIGLEAGKMIAGWKADAAVGVADLSGLSAGIVDDLREAGPRLGLHDASEMFASLRAQADPAEIALATAASSIAQRGLAQAGGLVGMREARLGEIIAAVEREARALGAEEIYVAAAPDLARDRRLVRIEGETALGQSFALRATVAYKGTWIRLVRTFGHDADGAGTDAAGARLAAAVAQLPSARGFAELPFWLVEGCRIAQPLVPLMGSRVSEPQPPPPRALVSVQVGLEIDGRWVLLGAPALLGAPGEATALLVQPG